MVQENHTTDNYFRALAPYGADVATGWPTSPNPPPSDQPHDRRAYFHWLTAGTSTHAQFDTAANLRFYEYLALTGAFLDHHCSGFGTNSTPNHLLLVGGQSPTLKNPSRSSTPEWDMPSVLGAADEHGLDWRAYAASNDYPVAFYTQLKGSPRVVGSAQFAADAAAGKLPPLVYLWHDPPGDEHPPANVTDGMNVVWQAVDAVVRGGGWEETVFLLTWDDWGGWDDHVHPPATEYTPDNVQLALGPRVPLLMFGGPVKPGIDHRWSSHPSVAKTVLQLLGLPALGVPRVDDDPGLADLVDAERAPNPAPPGFGAHLPIPPPPDPPVPVPPLPPPPVDRPVRVPRVILRGGKTLAPPGDVRLPKQPHPPG
jgi:phosphoesterase family protein